MWKPNDIALCVDIKPSRPARQDKWRAHIEEGGTYTVSHVTSCGCGTRLHFKEIPDLRKAWCTVCMDPVDCGFFAWRFIKLAGDDIRVDVVEELQRHLVK